MHGRYHVRDTLAVSAIMNREPPQLRKSISQDLDSGFLDADRQRHREYVERTVFQECDLVRKVLEPGMNQRRGECRFSAAWRRG